MNKFVYALIKNKKVPGRLLFTLLDNRRVYSAAGKAARGPLAVVWDTNAVCNARCRFCDYWRKHNFVSGKELSAKEKLRIIKMLGEAGVCFLSICSGEPLLSGDLGILIQEAKKSGMLVNISTNGSLLFDKAEMLIDKGVDFITVSIDSHDPRVHDRIRGYDGLFENAERGLERIRELRRGKTPHVEVRCLISRMNAYHLEQFFDYWSEKADSIVFKPIYENAANFFSMPGDMRIRKEDEGKFRNYYDIFLSKHKDLNTLYHREIPDFFFDKERLKKRYSCFAGSFFGHIDFEGNLYPCREMDVPRGDKSLGNLKETAFLDLWNSEKAGKTRDFLKTGPRCDCWMDKFIFNNYIQKFFYFVKYR
ncbi:MAG: hypothetical protein DRP85_04285 [Candidatus Makaraimicrobium thalassicum]|nr:MAG: hypothetical protein DRP85_04285 [Candidatus Omnitrophota bacterium]